MLIHVKHLEESWSIVSAFGVIILRLTPGNPLPPTTHSPTFFLLVPFQERKDDITQVPLPASFSLGPANGRKCPESRRWEERERMENFLPALLCSLLWQEPSPSIMKLHLAALPSLLQ